MVLLLLLAVLSLAGDYRRETIILGTNFPSSLVILVDASGSMAVVQADGFRPFSRACNEAQWVAEQATDDGRLRFAVFNDTHGYEPQGWIALPNKEAVDKALKWLRDWPAGGGTKPIEAVEMVIAESIDPLGVVIVTDGNPDGDSKAEATAIAKLNAERKPSPAVIGVLGIDPRRRKEDQFGVVVSRACGGAYVRTKTIDGEPK